MSDEQILEQIRLLDERLKDVANHIGKWMNATDRKILLRLDDLEKNVIATVERLHSK